MLTLPVTSNNEDVALCTRCGGECCKRIPGNYHPAQFGPSLEGVEELLRSGKAAVDWLECYRGPSGRAKCQPGYYLRPATANGQGVLDPSWGGPCVLLTDAGCSLPFADRPLGCQALVPDPKSPGKCRESAYPGKWEAAAAWWPYRKQLMRIVARVTNNEGA